MYALALQLFVLGAGALSLDVSRHTFAAAPEPHLLERTLSTVTYPILTWATQGVYYYVNITVGTPPQPQIVVLESDIDYTWLDAASASACQSTGSGQGCRGGTFDANSSSTYMPVSPAAAFSVTQVQGGSFSGLFVKDTITIGDISLPNMQFGLAQNINVTLGQDNHYPTGRLGLGYSSGSYSSVLEALKATGVIDSRLYSLSLNGGSSSGNIVFGGVDTSQYIGNLVSINFIPFAGGGVDVIEVPVTTITEMIVSTNGRPSVIFSGGQDDVSVYNSTAKNTALPVVLYFGQSSFSVPPTVFESILTQLTYINVNRSCSCDHRSSSDTLTLTFAGKIGIIVPASEFILPAYDPTTNKPVLDSNGNALCYFAVASDTSYQVGNYLNLGDAILRSTYLVFDLENGQYSIAQANTSPGASNIIKVGTSGVAAAVPGAIAASKQTYMILPTNTVSQAFVANTVTATTSTATGAGALPLNARPVTSDSGATSTAGGGSGSTSGGSGSSNNVGAIVGGVVGGIAAICIIAGIVYFLLRRKRKQMETQLPEVQRYSVETK